MFMKTLRMHLRKLLRMPCMQSVRLISVTSANSHFTKALCHSHNSSHSGFLVLHCQKSTLRADCLHLHGPIRIASSLFSSDRSMQLLALPLCTFAYHKNVIFSNKVYGLGS